MQLLHGHARAACVQRGQSQRRVPFSGSNCRRHANRHAAQLTRSPAAGRLVVRAGIDLASLGLDVPDIDGDLKSVQTELGASFKDGVAQTYGNARQAVEATSSGVCLVDRSHWPRIRVAGRDRIPLLQRFTTQDFSNLTAGQGCDTVLVDEKGGALDIATVSVSDSFVLLIVSPGRAAATLSWLQAAAAAAEMKVTMQDLSQRSTLISLVGPESENILKELAGEALVDTLGFNYGAHTLLNFRGTPVLISVGCGLPTPGYSLIADESVAGELFSVFASKGCILMGQQEWDCARTLAGRPAVGYEMSTEALHSPLEAGLYHAVSLRKTIGSDGMQAIATAEAAGMGSQLWGLQLTSAASRGAAISIEGGGLTGSVTSSTTTPIGEHFALGFIKTELGAKPNVSAGMPATVDGSPATVAPIAFASRQFLTDMLGPTTSSAAQAVVVGPGAELMAKQAEQQRLKQLQEAEAAEQARQQRIKENAERLAAWQAKQMGMVQNK